MDSSQHAARGPWRQQVHQLRAELDRTLILRRELAKLELQHDRRLVVQCLVVGALGVVLALVGLPLLLQLAAQELAQMTTLSSTTWTLIMSGFLLVTGLLLLAVAISRFRAQFRGLRDTFTQLNEDVIWLREWLPHSTVELGENGEPE